MCVSVVLQQQLQSNNKGHLEHYTRISWWKQEFFISFQAETPESEKEK